MDDKCRCRSEPVAYLDLGVGGYMDVGTDLTDEQLAALPKGRHMLGIIGTYGVDGYREVVPQIPDGLVPIFQIKLHSDTESTWHDATQSAYDVTPTKMRRTLYTAPQQAKGEPVAWEFSHNGYWTRTSEPEMHKQMGRPVRPLYTAPQPQQIPEGWKEASIAWEVCASIHRAYGKGKDPLFLTRQADFVKHANDARAMLEAAPEVKE